MYERISFKQGGCTVNLKLFASVSIALFFTYFCYANTSELPEGFEVLFNGSDFTNWIVPQGDGGHWRIVDDVIDYDAESEAPEDKNLWTQESFGNFILQLEWRIKDTPFINSNVPIVRPDGSHKLGIDGKPIRIAVPDSDSGIYLRGSSKAQVNIWCWPIGSGEVYGYRTDTSMPVEVRAGVTPKINADNNIGEWNKFVITLIGNKLSVELNGHTVIENAELPGLPDHGPIALQHHGSKKLGQWISPPSLVQFRNIFIKRLD